MRWNLRKLLVTSLLLSHPLVTGCGKNANPMAPEPAPAPVYQDVVVTLVSLYAVADGDGQREVNVPRVPAMRQIDSHCPTFQLALDVLAKPWCALILNSLQGGPFRFTEIRDRTRGPRDKMLSGRLKELEARGLISRRVDPGRPVRVTYELTETGRSFGEVAQAIERWGRGLKRLRRVSHKPGMKTTSR